MRYLSVIFLILILGFCHNTANAQALSGGFYDDKTPLITFTGAWSDSADANAYAGSRKSTSVVTSTDFSFSFSIWGDGFTLYVLKGISGSDANMCINSVCQTISFYSPTSPNFLGTLSVSNLGYGTHSITISKTSTTASFISVDAIYVHPPAPQPTSIPIINITMVYPTPQPTPTGTQFVYVGNFPEITEEASVQRLEIAGRETTITYDINPLEVVIVVMLGFIIIVMGASFVVKIWGAK